MYCPDSDESIDIIHQIQCQEKCGADITCVGISYSYKSGNTKYCNVVCWILILINICIKLKYIYLIKTSLFLKVVARKIDVMLWSDGSMEIIDQWAGQWRDIFDGWCDNI